MSRLIFASSLALLAAGHAAHGQSSQLSAVLAQMDKASADFKNARADAHYELEQRIGKMKDVTHQQGPLYIQRTGGKTEMGAVVYDVGDDGKPSAQPSKVIAYDGSTAQIFSPGVNQIDVFQAGANQAKYDTFLTLGFGGSGKDLASAWNITDNGPETLSDGGQQMKTEKLDLVSKDPGVRNSFSHVTIWLDPARGVSLKQVFFTSSGETKTTTYTNIKRNVSIDKKTFAIRKDGKTQVIPH